MSTRRHRSRIGVLISAGVITALAIGSSYVWLKKRTSSADANYRKPKSICVVLTESLFSGIDWAKLASIDSVIIQPPNFKVTIDQGVFPEHRIITCETNEGVWSVVRHLRKDELVVRTEEFQQIPNDIHRFSKPTEDLP
ncbi:LANO_0C00760g1_1 [Lachancea nothofagi CBS 11611]|uniref:Peroxisome assembly protein 22 n=1 Tax=Lachancea nothofagi CBS 11611 TaxID=1266666 RepID=A0A1G4J3V3_9SACH|nr:LANO_0C00760g1_1 [Lachancea nothofagi CBS 11611]